MEPVVVLCTFPNLDVARTIAKTLVEENLAACVNLQSASESIYRWEDKIETATEILALMKTTPSVYAALETRLQELHPYDVPEIVALPAHRSLKAYASWVAESVV